MITSITDLRAVADQARHVAETDRNVTTASDARIVEDVLRWITGDAGPTPELIAATGGAVTA